uniref:Transmembrane protein n=1 Tax=Syphacia muris TaxID=451379 RepID=A0A0N5AAV5_9BILA
MRQTSSLYYRFVNLQSALLICLLAAYQCTRVTTDYGAINTFYDIAQGISGGLQKGLEPSELQKRQSRLWLFILFTATFAACSFMIAAAVLYGISINDANNAIDKIQISLNRINNDTYIVINDALSTLEYLFRAEARFYTNRESDRLYDIPQYLSGEFKKTYGYSDLATANGQEDDAVDAFAKLSTSTINAISKLQKLNNTSCQQVINDAINTLTSYQTLASNESKLVIDDTFAQIQAKIDDVDKSVSVFHNKFTQTFVKINQELEFIKTAVELTGKQIRDVIQRIQINIATVSNQIQRIHDDPQKE